MDSLPSLSTASTRRTTASEASLSEVPNISDISLPLCAEDLWNGDYYSEGVNTTSGAVRTDYTNATLGQHKIDGSLPASQARAPRLNPTLVAFSNTSFVRAFYGGFGNIGRAFVMNSVKIMPERPLLLAVRLAMNILLDDFRRGDEERAKRMSRVWVGALTTLITTGKDPTLVQAILDQCGADFVDLVDRGEVEEAKYYFRAGIEGLLGVVEAENKLMASFAVNTCARVLEHALTTPHAAQFVEVIDDISQRVSVSISFRGAMEAQITAIVGLMFVQLAVKLRMDNTLDCLMKVISVVQQRLFIAAHPHAWLTTVVSWEGHPWLAEMLVVAATLLLKFERGGVKVFEETVIAFLEGILRVAISANRLGDVLALISKFTDGRSDGTSPSPTLLDREQEGTVVGEVLCPPRDYSGVQDSDLGRALRKALVALTKK
ncbi:uncharacterized protein B0H64DRAFT_102040 [Chaetomium fimeti]|uniref:Uncharacterized protein n=1 Tax=Chaetomium fimeti TaxID=1854472 RepID=A0AAE0HN35_9PEZI|nr:hypothetical protein B0H64DRAFT_102040 [Chaetomium fimeti]